MLALIATAFAILSFSGISSVYGPAWAPWAMGVRTGLPKSSTHSRAPPQQRERVCGLNANTPWYNLTLGLSMLVGRFLYIIPLLAAAGAWRPRSGGGYQRNVSDHGPLFVGLLIGTSSSGR